ncbi:MAG: nucleoside transporter C-terminal domain-containing protein [Deltaproteobacteria bacterium]
MRHSKGARIGLVVLAGLLFAAVAYADIGDQTIPVDWFGRVRSFFGLFVMIGIAVALSTDRKNISWRLVGTGVGLQLALGVITRTGPGEKFFGAFDKAVTAILGYTAQGSQFLFGNLAVQNTMPVGKSVVPMPAAGATPGWLADAKMAPVIPVEDFTWVNIGAYFAFGVLPTIIFFSSLMAVLYHLGVMQKLVNVLALFMQKTMRTSGAETLSATGNIFVGQTEAPLLVRPFIKEMTLSELMAVMTGGFATVAGGVMVAYVGILKNVFPGIAGHLLCASIMSAPAALVIAKIMVPEPDPTKSATFGTLKVDLPSQDANIIDAAARGAGEGLQLALNVGAMLLAFVALIAMVNGIIGGIAELLGATEPVTLELILGYVLRPLAWCMGIAWEDAQIIGSLLGIKTILNEFVAYLQLAQQAPQLASQRSFVIATYAMCGFANFGSIAIQIGGISPLAPERRSDLARLGLRAMIGGTLAAFMTACVIGVLI